MMSEASADLRPGEPTVIGWDKPPAARGRRWLVPPRPMMTRWLVPPVAALGAVAAFASLLEEWQITRIRDRDPRSSLAFQEVSLGVAWIGGWSVAYLTGILVLASCVALVLFGPRSGREHIRVTGLVVSGTVLAVLFAAASNLSKVSAAYGGTTFLMVEQDRFELQHGPGLTMAYVGTAGLGLALLLAGWLTPGARRPVLPGAPAAGFRETVDGTSGAAPADGHPGGFDAPHSEPAPADDWPWRRPRRAADRSGEADDNPLDLTVRPTQPFAPPD